ERRRPLHVARIEGDDVGFRLRTYERVDEPSGIGGTTESGRLVLGEEGGVDLAGVDVAGAVHHRSGGRAVDGQAAVAVPDDSSAFVGVLEGGAEGARLAREVFAVVEPPGRRRADYQNAPRPRDPAAFERLHRRAAFPRHGFSGAEREPGLLVGGDTG